MRWQSHQGENVCDISTVSLGQYFGPYLICGFARGRRTLFQRVFSPGDLPWPLETVCWDPGLWGWSMAESGCPCLPKISRNSFYWKNWGDANNKGHSNFYLICVTHLAPPLRQNAVSSSVPPRRLKPCSFKQCQKVRTLVYLLAFWAAFLQVVQLLWSPMRHESSGTSQPRLALVGPK